MSDLLGNPEDQFSRVEPQMNHVHINGRLMKKVVVYDSYELQCEKSGL